MTAGVRLASAAPTIGSGSSELKLPAGTKVHHGRAGEIDASACPLPARGHVGCFARVRVDSAAFTRVPRGVGGSSPSATLGDNGAYSPSYLQSAYDAPSATAGAGRLVAVVDAFDDPKAEADLGVYRSHFGLPACTTANGCFHKVDQTGGTDYPVPDGGWATEISLDLDMVSALCPNCHILLVEADSDDPADLGTAVDEAVSLGAVAVSNSYGIPVEDPSETSFDPYYDHPGVAVTVAAGDYGYGVSYPAASPYVIAVGGTSLYQATDNGTRNATETAWSGTGSGCSAVEPKPSWQHDAGCSMRTVADVSAVADPSTPVWIYDSYPEFQTTLKWASVGGTSAAAPIVAAMAALAGAPTGPQYTPAGYPYAEPASFNNITFGSNGSCSPTYLCTAGPGYNGPTGLGTPNGTRGLQPSTPSAPQALTTGAADGAVTLSWSAPATDGGSQITGYNLYRADAGAAPIATLSGDQDQFTDTGLTDGSPYVYALKAVNASGEGLAATAVAVPAVLDHLEISPASNSIVTGGASTYSVTGFDASSDPLGDETASTTFSISPDGSCTGATCTATAAGLHTVTASDGSVSVQAALTVEPLDHIEVSPPLVTITLDGISPQSQTYSAEGFDASGDARDVTAETSFSISPDGSCVAATCSATLLGIHQVTGSDGPISATAVLQVRPGPLTPTVTKVKPAYGPSTGGTVVTITGTNFLPSDLATTTVAFGAVPATNEVVKSSTRIVATAPAGTGTVDVTVSSSIGSVSLGTSPTSPADEFSYGPTILGLSKHEGPSRGGTVVTIVGTNFAGVSAVQFGSTAATNVTVVSSKRMKATSPPGVGTVNVVVITAGGTSTATAGDTFTYLP